MGLIWIENVFKKILMLKPICLVLIAVIIPVIYAFLGMKIKSLHWEFYHILETFTISVLVVFQLAGIKYFLCNIKTLERIGDLPINLKYRSTNIVAASVILPFIIIDLITRVLEGKLFYSIEPTAWSFLFDIYDRVVVYSTVFLMAIILCIILNMALVLNEFPSNPYKHFIKIDIISINQFGSLKPVRDLVMKLIIFYFIAISLAILSYVSPFNILGYESLFLIILLLIGLGFFFFGIKKIQKFLRNSIKDEINFINAEYRWYHKMLINNVSVGSYRAKEEKLELLYTYTILDILYSNGERMLQLYKNSKGYDFRTIIEFIGFFILPLVAFTSIITPSPSPLPITVEFIVTLIGTLATIYFGIRAR